MKEKIMADQYIAGTIFWVSLLFTSIEKHQTIINFTVEFEFKRFLHQKFAEAFFPLIEKKMIESFKKRADSLLN